MPIRLSLAASMACGRAQARKQGMGVRSRCRQPLLSPCAKFAWQPPLCFVPTTSLRSVPSAPPSSNDGATTAIASRSLHRLIHSFSPHSRFATFDPSSSSPTSLYPLPPVEIDKPKHRASGSPATPSSIPTTRHLRRSPRIPPSPPPLRCPPFARRPATRRPRCAHSQAALAAGSNGAGLDGIETGALRRNARQLGRAERRPTDRPPGRLVDHVRPVRRIVSSLTAASTSGATTPRESLSRALVRLASPRSVDNQLAQDGFRGLHEFLPHGAAAVMCVPRVQHINIERSRHRTRLLCEEHRAGQHAHLSGRHKRHAHRRPAYDGHHGASRAGEIHGCR